MFRELKSEGNEWEKRTKANCTDFRNQVIRSIVFVLPSVCHFCKWQKNSAWWMRVLNFSINFFPVQKQCHAFSLDKISHKVLLQHWHYARFVYGFCLRLSLGRNKVWIQIQKLLSDSCRMHGTSIQSLFDEGAAFTSFSALRELVGQKQALLFIHLACTIAKSSPSWGNFTSNKWLPWK